MPYASRAQQGLFHSPNSPVSKAEVHKWDEESKGEHGLAYHVKHSKHAGKKSAARAKVVREAGENEG